MVFIRMMDQVFEDYNVVFFSVLNSKCTSNYFLRYVYSHIFSVILIQLIFLN